MIMGKSILHVNQDLGKCFSTSEIKGYYNNLTEKVTMAPELLKSEEMPTLVIESGEKVFFPVAIFQYGLGAYDMYLQTGDPIYLTKFNQCVEWTYKNQDNKGRWNNFFYVYPENPYGAMAQGEGASLLLRAYVQSHEEKYLLASKRAIDYMLEDVRTGGTTNYANNETVFMEYTHLSAVMNGWIFAWFGLYDYVLATGDNKYRQILDKSYKSLINMLPLFTNKYWSMYDLDGHIASPFYHNLHIAQMQAMYKLTQDRIFDEYAQKWRRCQQNKIFTAIAFVKKAWQKL